MVQPLPVGRERLRRPGDIEGLRARILAARDPAAKTLALCTGTGCKAYGCDSLARALADEIAKAGLAAKVELKETGCPGFCERGTLVVLYPDEIFYQRVKASDAAEIVERTLGRGEVIERLLYVDPATGKQCVKESEIPFYARQTQNVLGNNRKIDPTRIEDYVAIGGYSALGKALGSMKPEEVLSEVKRSGLRGRGGGGFPAGVKWEECRNAPGPIRYVLCNADEGDPGAFMDRALLEGNPHSVLEGMVIGAYAIGACEGYVYVRNEYPLAVRNVKIAIQQMTDLGLLGDDILGSGFGLKIRVNRGGGAFVCGESTALMASIEGQVGEPRAKHIHTVVSGLHDRPSNLNNVETWANVPLIVNRGAAWYTGIGTGDVSKNPWGGSKGTKIFSLVGKVNNTGLVEVPMGITLREVIFGIGGGIPNGKKFKAVQTGGPSGGCIPEEHLDLPVDFDKLAQVGSMMGSGGMIVMDEATCMVDVARYFMNFLKFESCGKCTSCREGTRRLHEIVTRITQGKGKESDLALLGELSECVAEASLCALGGTAPNPVMSTLRYFRDEYEEHIRDGRCRAKVCKALIRHDILEGPCNGCMVCARNCPVGAISGKKKELQVIDPTKCIQCGVCFEVCKFDAVRVL